MPTPLFPIQTTSCGSAFTAPARIWATPSESISPVPSDATRTASSAPRARHSRRPVSARAGPYVTTVTVPPFASFAFRASSSAYSSYGETIHLTSASSIDFPSAPILIFVSVSGTCATRTT